MNRWRFAKRRQNAVVEDIDMRAARGLCLRALPLRLWDEDERGQRR